MNDAERIAIMARDLANSGPRRFDLLLGVWAVLPEFLREWPEDAVFEWIRGSLQFGQAELGQKAGVSASRVSLIEGGADAKLSTWRKLYRAMGFELVLVPITSLSETKLKECAAQGRPGNHFLYSRARPRRRRMREARQPPGQ